MDETAAAYFSRILNEFAIRSAKFCSICDTSVNSLIL